MFYHGVWLVFCLNFRCMALKAVYLLVPQVRAIHLHLFGLSRLGSQSLVLSWIKIIMYGMGMG